MNDKELAAVEDVLGYRFQNPTLLRQAFTRRSYTAEYAAQKKRPAPVECNEVLELIGDSVLSTALLTILSDRHGKVTGRGYESDFGEGVFTDIKANLCDKAALSKIIDGLKTKNGERFSTLMDVSKGDRNNGVIESASPKEDLFESILGAIALDCGMDFSVIVPIVARLDDPERLTTHAADRDAKSILKEYCEKERFTLAFPRLGKTGPDNAPTYTVECRVNGEVMGTGSARNQKAAEQEAAKIALAAIVR